MKDTRVVSIFAILFFALLYQPAFVSGDTIYFDPDGNSSHQASYRNG